MKLISWAVAGDTTFITARCEGDSTCPTHTFAKDWKGWHRKERDPVLGRAVWQDALVPDIMLDGLLEQAEAQYLEKKE